MYRLEGPTLIVIPPYIMHKTEGGPYERFNIYVTESYLNDFESKVLKSKALETLIPEPEQVGELVALLEEMTNLNDHRYKAEITKTLFSYYIFRLKARILQRPVFLWFHPPASHRHSSNPPEQVLWKPWSKQITMKRVFQRPV